MLEPSIHQIFFLTCWFTYSIHYHIQLFMSMPCPTHDFIGTLIVSFFCWTCFEMPNETSWIQERYTLMRKACFMEVIFPLTSVNKFLSNDNLTFACVQRIDHSNSLYWPVNVWLILLCFALSHSCYYLQDDIWQPMGVHMHLLLIPLLALFVTCKY